MTVINHDYQGLSIGTVSPVGPKPFVRDLDSPVTDGGLDVVHRDNQSVIESVPTDGCIGTATQTGNLRATVTDGPRSEFEDISASTGIPSPVNAMSEPSVETLSNVRGQLRTVITVRDLSDPKIPVPRNVDGLAHRERVPAIHSVDGYLPAVFQLGSDGVACVLEESDGNDRQATWNVPIPQKVTPD